MASARTTSRAPALEPALGLEDQEQEEVGVHFCQLAIQNFSLRDLGTLDFPSLALSMSTRGRWKEKTTTREGEKKKRIA